MGELNVPGEATRPARFFTSRIRPLHPSTINASTVAAIAMPARIQIVSTNASFGTCFIERHLIDL
jgi:hypothetical protein